MKARVILSNITTEPKLLSIQEKVDIVITVNAT